MNRTKIQWGWLVFAILIIFCVAPTRAQQAPPVTAVPQGLPVGPQALPAATGAPTAQATPDPLGTYIHIPHKGVFWFARTVYSGLLAHISNASGITFALNLLRSFFIIMALWATIQVLANNGNFQQQIGRIVELFLTAMMLTLLITHFQAIAGWTINQGCVAAFSAVKSTNVASGSGSSNIGGSACSSYFNPLKIIGLGLTTFADFADTNPIKQPGSTCKGKDPKTWTNCIGDVVVAIDPFAQLWIGIEWIFVFCINVMFSIPIVFVCFEMAGALGGLQIEILFVSLVAPMLLPFGMVPALESVAHGAKAYLLHTFARAMFLFMPLAISMKVLHSIIASITPGHANIVTMLSAVFAFLFLRNLINILQKHIPQIIASGGQQGTLTKLFGDKGLIEQAGPVVGPLAASTGLIVGAARGIAKTGEQMVGGGSSDGGPGGNGQDGDPGGDGGSGGSGGSGGGSGGSAAATAGLIAAGIATVATGGLAAPAALAAVGGEAAAAGGAAAAGEAGAAAAGEAGAGAAAGGLGADAAAAVGEETVGSGEAGNAVQSATDVGDSGNSGSANNSSGNTKNNMRRPQQSSSRSSNQSGSQTLESSSAAEIAAEAAGAMAAGVGGAYSAPEGVASAGVSSGGASIQTKPGATVSHVGGEVYHVSNPDGSSYDTISGASPNSTFSPEAARAGTPPWPTNSGAPSSPPPGGGGFSSPPPGGGGFSSPPPGGGGGGFSSPPPGGGGPPAAPPPGKWQNFSTAVASAAQFAPGILGSVARSFQSGYNIGNIGRSVVTGERPNLIMPLFLQALGQLNQNQPPKQ